MKTIDTLIKGDKNVRQLFTIFKGNKTNTVIEYKLSKYKAEISRLSNTTISLFYKGNIPEDADEVELVIYYDQIYRALCKVIKINKSNIILSFPEKVKKRIKRKYNRIKTPNEVKASFIIMENDGKIPHMVNNALKRHTILSTLYKKLFDKKYNVYKIIREGIKALEGIGIILEFKLYNKEEGKKHNIISNIVNKTGKAIYIPNVQNKELYVKDYKNEYFTSLLPYIQILRQYNPDSKYISNAIGKLINDHLYSLKSYICCPIVILSKIEGYISIGTRNSTLYANDLYFLLSICHIIAEAIYKTNISNTNEKTIKTYFPLVDLSAGGLNLKIEDNEIKNYLEEGTIIKLILQLSADDKKIMRLISQMIRVEPEEDNFAMKFIEITHNTKGYIMDYVKRKLIFSKPTA